MHSPRCPLLLTRVLGCCIALLMFLITAIAAPSTASAAGNVPSGFEQGPASTEQLALYARIASVNACIATRAGQDFEPAAGVAGETIAQLILGLHKGLIASSGSTPLTLEELRRGSINAAVIGATEICPKEVPADLSEKVRQALANQTSAATG